MLRAASRAGTYAGAGAGTYAGAGAGTGARASFRGPGRSCRGPRRNAACVRMLCLFTVEFDRVKRRADPGGMYRASIKTLRSLEHMG